MARQHRGNRLAPELPLIIGIGGGWFWLWYIGGAGVMNGQFDGYDWPGYTQNAWMVAHEHVGATQGLRGLLHPFLMGHLGEWLGQYANSGILIASASIGLLVFAVGLSVRIFSGPWFGGASALLVGGLSGVAYASHWSNSYALLGGLSAAGIAMSCVCMRYPRWYVGILSGILTGLAYATDLRGMLFLPLAIAAPFVSDVRWSKRILCALLVVGSFQVGPNFRSWLGAPPAVSSEERVLIQQPVVKRWLQQAQDPELDKACREASPTTFWTVSFLQTPCAKQIVRHNISHRLKSYFPFGLVLTWYLTLGVLLPGREGFKGSLRGSLFLGGAVAPVILMGAWTPFANRYIIQMLLPIACIVPIAMGRGIQSIAPKGLVGILQAVAAIWVLNYAWELDISERLRSNEQGGYSHFNEIAATVNGYLGDEDKYMDCSNHFVNIAILPRQTHRGMPILNADNEGSRCLQWIFSSEDAPEGRNVWFSTAIDKKIRIRQGTDPNDRQSLAPIVKESGLWELVWEKTPFQLWRRY